MLNATSIPMQVLTQIPDPVSDTPSAVAIGNFDGVHRGHQALLEAVGRDAARRGIRSVVITFDPHPLEEIAPERAPVPITTLDQRIRLIERHAIDVLFVQKFDDGFRHLSPDAFVQRYLVEAFGARSVTVGFNFRFGFRHSGDFRTLERYSGCFDTVAVPAVLDRGVPISSSLVRRLLEEGHVGLARRMLDRCYEIEGWVVSGAGRGRRETVPTLNLDPRNRLIPRDGVYLTRAAVDDDIVFRPAVTNVGVRPTFDEGPRSIETFVLDGNLSTPGRLRLRFVKRLRDERRFDDPAALRAQIMKDVRIAEKYFRRVDRLTRETTHCHPAAPGE
jgi:riboflavin kinase/FMN adenylyltransferase